MNDVRKPVNSMDLFTQNFQYVIMLSILKGGFTPRGDPLVPIG